MISKNISAMMRIKNEEEFLYVSVKSIVDSVDEVIIIDNLSNDSSSEIIEKLCQEYPGKVFSYQYSHEVGKVGKDNLKLSSGLFSRFSPRLLSNYYNWCLGKCTMSHVLKWDGDMIATEELILKINEFKNSSKETFWIRGANLYSDLEHLICCDLSATEGYEVDNHYSKSLDNYITPYTDYEARIFPKNFAKYDTGFWWCERLTSPFLLDGFHYWEEYGYWFEEVGYLHMKYCKKDPYANLSNDFKQILASVVTKGEPITSDLLSTLKRWLSICSQAS